MCVLVRAVVVVCLVLFNDGCSESQAGNFRKNLPAHYNTPTHPTGVAIGRERTRMRKLLKDYESPETDFTLYKRWGGERIRE